MTNLLLAALLPLGSQALVAVRPAAAIDTSIATITSTYASTITTTSVTTFPVTTVATTCTVSGSKPPTSSCANSAWTVGSYYWQESCSSASAVGGNVNAALNPYTRMANIWDCYVYCSIFNALCNGVNYFPSQSSCQYLTGTGGSLLHHYYFGFYIGYCGDYDCRLYHYLHYYNLYHFVTGIVDSFIDPYISRYSFFFASFFFASFFFASFFFAGFFFAGFFFAGFFTAVVAEVFSFIIAGLEPRIFFFAKCFAF
ncbi:hypothetical protein N7466_010555 [Penicillium verhagenii]|uniref:uncharacterized protein n=1 Tax=Penicillium verhagenii TaxID=1562060 RepID=UPI0025457B70|nr:uncharacterized protein N7466_010555 [Penicillium verhagenii]KAJ5918563.1 hypothetical protein N7466_010555 [Penicillium verhagenii]